MKFSDILGNEQAAQHLRRLIDADRLPHALLLHGPAGVPKLALARAAVQYLHCTDRHDGEPCGKCAMCRQHESMNQTDTYYSFPYLGSSDSKPLTCDDYMSEWKEFLHDKPIVEDYQHWLHLLKSDNAQPQIYVKESESILRKMSLSAYTTRYKVLIMWLPEKMKEETANKLLKIIEEPYDDCKFILVSDNAQDILPTIFSRTQRLELHRPSPQAIADYLTARYGIDPQDALAVAAPADGNVTAAEQALEKDNEGHEFHERFVELMRLAYARNLAKLKLWSEQVADFKREKSRRFLTYAARQVRENFIYNLHQPNLNYLTREEQTFSTRFAPFINENNVERMHEEFNRAEQDIRGNANARIVLFDLAIRITILIKV